MEEAVEKKVEAFKRTNKVMWCGVMSSGDRLPSGITNSDVIAVLENGSTWILRKQSEWQYSWCAVAEIHGARA